MSNSNNLQLDPLPSNLMHLFNNTPIRTAVERFPDRSGGSFANILTDAFATTMATDAKDKGNSAQLITGEADDLSGMLIDMQKAELALQLTLQIRNKIIDAYNEVIKMSI